MPSKIAFVILIGFVGMSLPSHAVSDAEVKLISEAVRVKFSDLKVFCNLAEEERRKIVTQTTMQLVSTRKVSDPFSSGPQAGNQLRQECGIETPVDMRKVRWTTSATPLEFAEAREALDPHTDLAALANKVFKPNGTGPFPAVVISQTKSISEHLKVHALELMGAGFAVLVVDTFGPRNYKVGINEPFPAEFAKDAYDALAYLLALPYIEKNRIFQTGYSYGGLAAVLLASPEGASQLQAKSRFRATVANYGACTIAGSYTGTQAQATQMDMLSTDSDRPILMLMGDLDIETPAKTCFPRLEEMKAAGKDVHWHIFTNTTHAWDKAEHNGHIYKTVNGESMVYRYDPAVSKDATERMIAFFNQYQ